MDNIAKEGDLRVKSEYFVYIFYIVSILTAAELQQ